MTTQANFAHDTTVKWGRALGNGVTALAVASEAIEHVRLHRDTTVLARMIDRARAGGDNPAAAQLSFLVRQCFDGAKMGKDKKGNATIKIKDATVSNTAPTIIAGLVENGRSLRSPEVRKAFTSDGDTPSKRDADAVAKSVVRMAKKNGLTKAKLNKMIEALWNEVKIDE